MTAPRACTADLNLLTGQPVPEGTVVSFLGKAMRGQYGSVVVPDTVSVTADADGRVAVNLLPGDWTIKVKGQTLLWSADFGLGETGTTIIGELIGQAAPPITDARVAAAEAARDQALAAVPAAAAAAQEVIDSQLLVYVTDDTNSVTIQVGQSMVIAEPSSPFPSVTLEIVTP
jgi:hypothetical protein